MDKSQLNFSFPEKVFTVSEFLDFLNEFLRPQMVVVKGEVGSKPGNYPNYSFFNLLDDKGSILKCFALSGVVEKLGLGIKEGMEVKVFGYPEIWRKRGEMKFRVLRINLVGEGLLRKQFEVLKEKLTKEGYFDEGKKKAIPLFPINIGLITSKFGKGAKKDFLTHLGKFGFKIKFYDTRVEGINAPGEISKAIAWFNENMPKLDVIVLIRGGGDWESLQPFNSEELVKAIFASKIPIISGVGHEDDQTLADFAADLRVSTPTAAAKALTANWQNAEERVSNFKDEINFLFSSYLERGKRNIDSYFSSISSAVEKEIYVKKNRANEILANIKLHIQRYLVGFRETERIFFSNGDKLSTKIKEGKKMVTETIAAMENSTKAWQEAVAEKISYQEGKLKTANPELKLKQGYSLVFDKDNNIVKGTDKLKLSEKLKVKFYKGHIISEIKEILKK